MKSCLYDCTLEHTRIRPAKHHFKLGSFMFWIDLNELSQLGSSTRCFSTLSSKLYHFVESDYLPGKDGTLIDRLKSLVMELSLKPESTFSLKSEIAQVRLLTNVRILNYVFNPISLFFCFDKNEQPLCVLIEVENTFHEKKAYLVPFSESGSYESKQKKYFYVSPFSSVEQYFHFNISAKDEKLKVSINTEDHDGVVLSTYLTGKRVELSDMNLLRLTVRYPLVTLRTITLIHWHALLLYLKNIPYFRKEKDLHLQMGILKNSSPIENEKLNTGGVSSRK